jgi:ATP-dependent helicase HrpB
MQALPIDPFLAQAIAALRAQKNLVLVAEPGAGKTTRLPRALLDAGFGEHGEIVVLEPRRIAARMAAARVASELGEPLGERIGYQVRFDERVSKRTQVRFVTEGVLTRKLASDPRLPGIAAIVLDELHERHLQGDLALALARKLQRTHRPDLCIVAMSATLEAEPVAAFLASSVMHVPGRTFAVRVSYDDKPDERPLEERVRGALARVMREAVEGDVLVFLPGAAEIRRCAELLAQKPLGVPLDVAALHGDLPAEEQDRAVRPSPAGRRKVILSTNIAESSLTIEGVRAVIDSGLSRVASHSPWSGLPQLALSKVSRASAAQRAGRAGRLAQGVCHRLYTQHDHDSRPQHDKPEIARADLCETLLAVRAAGAVLEPSDWLLAPPVEAARAANELLERLRACDASGAITERGARMAKLPVHPRLAAIALHAHALGRLEEGVALAALLAERDIARSTRARFDGQRGGAGADVQVGPSDALDRLERFERIEGSGFSSSAMRNDELDPAAVSAVRRVRDRLLRALERLPRPAGQDDGWGDAPLLAALLAGFSDRVARRRSAGSDQLVLGRGGSLKQAPSSVVRDAELVVVLDAREQDRGAVAQLVSAIEPEMLLELFPERVLELDEVRFDAARERVERVQGLSYEGIVLDHSQTLAEPDARTAALLAQAARERGLTNLFDLDALEHYERRVRHASRAAGTAPLPDNAREQALLDTCLGKRTFGELRQASVLDALTALTAPDTLAALARVAPDSIALPSGRRLDVHYEADRPPWVQSRLQDFFGMQRGPMLGSEPLVLHLLAPNQRPVQVTTDLAGFWQRHYPDLRKQLMRRYPRHSWPDNPLIALPPAPKR